MGRTCVISIVFSMALCKPLYAHRPIFSEKAATDPNTAVLITQPAISQVIYREITKEAKQIWLAFDANERFELFIQIGVPVLDRLKQFRPAMLVVGPGLPEGNVQCDLPNGAGAKAFPTDGVKQPRFFHEHFTGTDSWILRSETVVLPKSGRHYVVAYAPSGQEGKLWLSIGSKEAFGLADWAKFREWKKRIRKFHEISEGGGELRIPILSEIADLLRSAGTTTAKTSATVCCTCFLSKRASTEGTDMVLAYLRRWTLTTNTTLLSCKWVLKKSPGTAIMLPTSKLGRQVT
jgi:hypothetical protein